MGRVRRYKKYKACDPFAKRGGKKDDGVDVHDEPPDLHEEKSRETKRKRERDWGDEGKRELSLQREAFRDLRLKAEKV